MSDGSKKTTRRDLLRTGACAAAVAGVYASAHGLWALRNSSEETAVWQIDPHKCVACGNCATYCVLETSAVKCVHAFAMCGYCDLCFGYYRPRHTARDTAAENQMCPTGAIKRSFVEDPYYEYTIDESLCVGCGKCVKGCGDQGNGSLYLQVRHDRCLNCSQCEIAAACPADAFVRVPANRPYLPKDVKRED
jgi:electron transport complex protein RnfB